MKKRLVIAHNLSIESLRFANTLGGLPCPSFAIVPNNIPFTKFGEITLLFDHKNYHPKKQPTFDADVYSARMPKAFYSFDKDRVSAFKAITNASLSSHNIPLAYWQATAEDEDILHQGYVEFLLHAQGNIPTLLAYADSIGQSPTINRSPLPCPIKFISGDTYSKLSQQGLIGARSDSEQLAELSSQAYRCFVDYINAQHHLFANLPESEFSEYKQDESDRFFRFTEGTPTLRLHHVEELARHGRRLGVGSDMIDTEHLRAQLESLVASPAQKVRFISWLDQYMANAFSNPVFYKSLQGKNRRKVPFTLENLVKYMKGQIQRCEGSFFYGAGDIRAAPSMQMMSKTEIANKMDSIVSEKEFLVAKERLNADLQSWPDKLRRYFKFSATSFQYRDAIYELLGEYASTGRIESMAHSLHVEKMPPALVDKLDRFMDSLRHAPTTYFEVKNQRAISLDEFSAAIVPFHTPKDVVRMLEGLGLSVVGYDPEDDNDRLVAMSQFESLMFGEGKEFDLQLTFDRQLLRA